jgi:23S rRNA pseudouridine955/2504/2580 synthase/23S rRNA pseudouridine1911/1915/1917 synthase
MNKIEILFENDTFVAVNKPAGILVIPDQYTDRTITLVGKLSQQIGMKAWTVHRIDRDTTGVVLFAKHAKAHSFLCRQFEKAEVKKKYIALVNGVLQEPQGVITHNIRIEGRNVEIHPKGKSAITNYRVLEQFRHFALIELEPKTGRRHQIRIHMWAQGHPLAVDPEYGQRETLCLSEFKKNYKATGKERPLLGRLSLHAAEITFKEPASGETITVSAPLPEDFELTLKQLRKYDALPGNPAMIER